MTPHIRQAVAADVPAVVALLIDDVLGEAREDADPAPYRAAFARMQAQNGNRVFVAEQDGAIVGTYQLIFIEGLSLRATLRAQIESVRVRSDLRGKGLGTALMRDAIARARDSGCGLVQLTSNATRTEAQRFYTALGFVGSHVGYKLKL